MALVVALAPAYSTYLFYTLKINGQSLHKQDTDKLLKKELRPWLWRKLNFQPHLVRKTKEGKGFTEAVVGRKIHNMYLPAMQVLPTLSNILNALQEDDTIQCSKSHLRKVLIELGLKWKEFQPQRKILTERPDIDNWRIISLIQIKCLSGGKML